VEQEVFLRDRALSTPGRAARRRTFAQGPTSPRKNYAKNQRETEPRRRHHKGMRRIAVLGSGFAVLLSLASSARAAAASSPPLAPTAAVTTSRGPVVPLSRLLHLAPSRELGLAGANLRLQLPALVAPYVEARLGDGVSASRPDGALLIPGTSIGLGGALGDRGAGLLTARGVDLGVDVHRFRGGYVSLAIGWQRSTVLVGGLDAHERLVANDVSVDGVMFKIGFSF
jgi:hypothetical protein